MAGYALGFVMGATTGPRFRFYRKALRRCRTPARPSGPPQPLAADMIRYARWEDEQIQRALRDEPPTPN